jgi:hypothetical protein
VKPASRQPAAKTGNPLAATLREQIKLYEAKTPPDAARGAGDLK